jgi:transposase-like protein
VFSDLETRCVANILIAATDGLERIGEALAAAFRMTTLRSCISHLIRNSLDFASARSKGKKCKYLAQALRSVVAHVRAQHQRQQAPSALV